MDTAFMMPLVTVRDVCIMLRTSPGVVWPSGEAWQRRRFNVEYTSHAAYGSCYVMRTLHPVSLSAQLSLSREQFTMPSQQSSGGCVVTSQIGSQSMLSATAPL